MNDQILSMLTKGVGAAIPGAAPIMSAGIMGLDMLSTQLNKRPATTPRDSQLYSTNYTQQLQNIFKGGGYLQGGEFKQYNFAPHSKGGGKIDINANPSRFGMAELEKKENAFKLPNGTYYIFSDFLKFE